jgi:hypothetical protein
MKTVWLKTRKWKPSDLEGKSVEFRITFADAIAEGLGEFVVRGNGIELMGIDIIVPHPQDYYDQYYHVRAGHVGWQCERTGTPASLGFHVRPTYPVQ